MIRSLLLGLGTLWLSSAACAGPILSFDGLPSTFTPGTSFEFDVRLSGAVDLNSYFVELLLEADSGTAGVDFFFESATPASTDYVFEGKLAGYFYSETNTSSSNQHRLSLSDFLDDFNAGVTTVAGGNDRIARVRVGTSQVVSSLRVLFDGEYLELFNPDFESLTDVQLTDYPSLSAAGPGPVVPEPSTLVLGLIGSSTIWLMRHGRRIAHEK